MRSCQCLQGSSSKSQRGGNRQDGEGKEKKKKES